MPQTRLRWLWITLAIILGVIVVALVLVLAFIDPIARAVLEAKLDDVDGMAAEVASADIDLSDKVFVFEGIRIEKQPGGSPESWAQIDRVEVELIGSFFGGSDTRALISIHEPKLHLVRHADPEREQLAPTAEARQQLRELSDYEVERVTIHDAEVRFVDAIQRVDLQVSSLDASLTNLVGPEPTAYELHGKVEDSGQLDLRGTVEPREEPLAWTIDGALMGFPLESLEPLIVRYVGVTVTDGYLAIGLHLTGREGELEGWIAPELAQVDFEGQLEAGLAKPLRAFGLQAASKMLEDPIAPGLGNRIQVVGTYGEARGFSLRATDADNSWLQEKLLQVEGGRPGDQS
ncbi:MAG: DUF748 domain-containing protein [Deltaproteobacteria bacterium]|nr:DUF748 domain-containing protein [Deltaproteobacteria bacterium]